MRGISMIKPFLASQAATLLAIFDRAVPVTSQNCGFCSASRSRISRWLRSFTEDEMVNLKVRCEEYLVHSTATLLWLEFGSDGCRDGVEDAVTALLALPGLDRDEIWLRARLLNALGVLCVRDGHHSPV